MSTAGTKARKARQRAGEEKYFKAPKVGTPVNQRRSTKDRWARQVTRWLNAGDINRKEHARLGREIAKGKEPSMPKHRLARALGRGGK